MINETYSAFVQGFMPTLARPDVDVLDGLTTAIIVDQERMGANVRSTVGTATDANAMLRILFSRLGQPHIGSPQAFSFNVASAHGSGAVTRGAWRGQGDEAELLGHRRHVSALRGHGLGDRLRPDPALRRQQVHQPGCLQDPRLQHGRLVRPYLRRLGLPRPGQAHQPVHQERARRPALQGAHQGQDRQHQPDLRGSHPQDPALVPVQGHRHAPAAHPGLRGARGDLQRLPRVRRHPAQRGRTVVAASTASASPTPARCRSATWPSGCADSMRRRWRRCSPRCARPSTRSWRSGWATSASTGRRARSRAARHSAPR